MCPCVYVLELEDDCWYVGITHNLNFRLAQHMAGGGARWTKLHKPLRVAEVIFKDASLALENATTKEYMERYGEENVRGGSWCRVKKSSSGSE